VIRLFTKYLEAPTAVKEVSLTTKDPKYFDRCLLDYRKCILEMLESNEICVE
jgi:hypothetical protein